MVLSDEEYIEERLRQLELLEGPRPSALPEVVSTASQDDMKAYAVPALAKTVVKSPEDIEEQLRHLEMCGIPRPPMAPGIVGEVGHNLDVQDITTSAEPTVNSSAEDIGEQFGGLELRSKPPLSAPRVSISTKQRDESALALWLKPRLVSPVQVRKTQNDTDLKLQLLNLPSEILTQILSHLLVHPHSIPLPTLEYDKCRGPRPHDPSLSPSILSTCRLLHTIGKHLLYGGNVFNAGEPLRFWSLDNPGPGSTPMSAPNMSLITQLEAQIEPLIDAFHRNRLWWVGSLALNELTHFYPGNLDHVQSIRCALPFTSYGRSEMAKHWKGEGFYTNDHIDYAVHWHALSIAGSVATIHQGHMKMFRAMWMGRNEKVDMGIILCKDGRGLKPAIQANKLRGVNFQAELEVDEAQGRVREIDGKRAGYCYSGSVDCNRQWILAEGDER